MEHKYKLNSEFLEDCFFGNEPQIGLWTGNFLKLIFIGKKHKMNSEFFWNILIKKEPRNELRISWRLFVSANCSEKRGLNIIDDLEENMKNRKERLKYFSLSPTLPWGVQTRCSNPHHRQPWWPLPCNRDHQGSWNQKLQLYYNQ